MSSILSAVFPAPSPDPRPAARRRACRPALEALEDRLAPAGQVLTFAPNVDSWVDPASPASNYGTSTHLYTAPSSAESYVRFAVAGASGPAQSAQLRLYVLGGASAGPAVYSSGTSWSETGLTWSNRPARTSAALDSHPGAVASSAWLTFDVTAAVTGNGTYSFDLAAVAGSWVQLASREGAQPPQLVVTTGGTTTAPAAPSNLAAAAASTSQVNLTWTDNANNETGFKVERSTDGTTFAQVASVGTNATAYSDTGLAAATKYYYRIRATNTAGDSASSNMASATTQATATPAAPSNLAAASESTSQANLAWTDNASNETGFKVERSADGTTFAQVALVGANVTAYSDTGLAVATKYYYRVRATNAAGNSAYSNMASATTASTTQTTDPVTNLHYTPNANFVNGQYVPAQDGFNLADASSVDEVNALPAGDKALVWIGMGDGATSAFQSAVQPFIGNPKVFGFYLYDEPDPTGQYGPLVTAASLKAESDWIHAHDPGTKTFIIMMNMASDTNPSFANTYNPANTDIDLFGLDPYPVQPQFSGGVNYSIIPASVKAAEAWGIPQSQIVPVYQAFGGGGYAAWTLPTASQEQQILATWGSVVLHPVFDYAYSWGIQENDSALVNTPSLQSVLAAHNAASTAAATPSLAAASPSVTGPAATPLVAPAAGAVSAPTVDQPSLVPPVTPSLPADPGQPGSVTAPAAGPVPSAGGVTGAVLLQVAGQQASLATGAQDGADGAGPDLGGIPDFLGPGELGLDGLLALERLTEYASVPGA